MLVCAVQKRAYLLNYFRGKPEREKRKERIKKGEQTKPCIIYSLLGLQQRIVEIIEFLCQKSDDNNKIIVMNICFYRS